MCALSLKTMEEPDRLYRQMENLYQLRATVDDVNRERWITESRKWRERAELESSRIF
jgi:hypothetical protein